MKKLFLTGVDHIPMIQKGDDIANIILDSAKKTKAIINNGDVIVIAQKIISKAEGAIAYLDNITPGEKAREIAKKTGRDARLCQLYLDEATEVLAIKGRMVITRHRLGYVGSSSGIDKSNIAPNGEGVVVLLPRDPDKSARAIRKSILDLTGKEVAIVINDSCGRDYRGGSVGMAIGVAGIEPLYIQEKEDLFGNLGTSHIAIVDEIAAAASILMGQANEAVPVVIVSGVSYTSSSNSSIQSFIHK